MQAGRRPRNIRARIAAWRPAYFREQSPRNPGRHEATAQRKDLQERLGHVRDHDVLSQWFAGQARRASRPGEEALRAEAESLASWFAEESRRHHRELLAARPIEIVQRALDEMGQGRSEFRAGA